MTRQAAAALWLNAAGTAATGLFLLAMAVYVVRSVRAHAARRRVPVPYWLMLTFLGVALALDVARLAVAQTFANWFGAAGHVAMIGLVLWMRRILNRLDARLAAYVADTARLRAECEAERAEHRAAGVALIRQLEDGPR